jgi:hypothetical protein
VFGCVRGQLKGETASTFRASCHAKVRAHRCIEFLEQRYCCSSRSCQSPFSRPLLHSAFLPSPTNRPKKTNRREKKSSVDLGFRLFLFCGNKHTHIDLAHQPYARRVDPSALAFSLSSHRYSYIGLLFTSLFIT